MKKIILSSLASILAFGATAQELKLPYYGARPPTDDFTSSYWCKELVQGQPAKVFSPGELDVRSCDISLWNLTQYTAQELADVISFDSRTKFPPRTKLPKGFDPHRILQNGKNPGLGVRNLHAQGITGKGVSMAIIDQNLLLGHIEYAPNVVFYEEDSFWNSIGAGASMHAPAVVSIAAGKSVGVAPAARIFAFAGKFEINSGTFDARPIATMLHRVAELNAQLPPKEKIKVVSISRAFTPKDNGAEEFNAAKQALEKDGVAVFITNDVDTLSRKHSLNDPENTANYCRPAYWLGNVSSLSADMQDVVVPTDFRVIASPTGNNDYVHYANGGLSWAVPYVAGLYALGVQVYPQLTKEIFVKTAHETATVRNCEYEGEKFSMPLVNPVRLINYLKSLNRSAQN